LDILVYIDDFAGVSTSRESAEQHFHTLQATLKQLGLQEAAHKASPPTQKLIWLGLEFSSVDMTVALPEDKLQATLQLVSEWQGKHSATLHSLRVLMGKLLYVAQVSPPARLFLNRMLATLRSCPPTGSINLTLQFKKDLAWFAHFLPSTNGIFIIQPEAPPQHHIYVDSCLSGAGALYNQQAYHTVYPEELRRQEHPICHLEALNCVAALKQWGPQLTGKAVTLHCDSATAVAVLQLGKGRDPFVQQCARELWLTTAIQDIQLKVEHVPGEQLALTADALSRYHLGPIYRKRVQELIKLSNVQLTPPRQGIFQLSPHL
jgi:hypothetical protein